MKLSEPARAMRTFRDWGVKVEKPQREVPTPTRCFGGAYRISAFAGVYLRSPVFSRRRTEASGNVARLTYMSLSEAHLGLWSASLSRERFLTKRGA